MCGIVEGYGSSATIRPVGTIRAEKGISLWFRVSITSRYDLGVESDIKHHFLPSFSSYFPFNGSENELSFLPSIKDLKTNRFRHSTHLERTFGCHYQKYVFQGSWESSLRQE